MNKNKVVVLIPQKLNLHKDIARKNIEVVDIVTSGLDDVTIIRQIDGGDAHVRTLQQRCEHTRTIRQYMIDKYVVYNDFTHVVWIDADLIKASGEFCKKWLKECPNDIVAPMIFHDKTNRFYDISGFVYNEGNGMKWSSMTAPFFGTIVPDNRGYVPLEGVGCMYMLPASVYKLHMAQHVTVEGFTDHLSPCLKAKSIGMNVYADIKCTAIHAYLPDYGEKNH